jgi:hypothetical protein
MPFGSFEGDLPLNGLRISKLDRPQLLPTARLREIVGGDIAYTARTLLRGYCICKGARAEGSEARDSRCGEGWRRG